MKNRTSRNSGAAFVIRMRDVAGIHTCAPPAFPNFIKARTTSQQNACINNLRQVDGAIQQWALEYKKDAAAVVAIADVTPYLKNSVVCPAGGTTFANSYTLVDVATQPLCQKVPASHVCP